jgi:hypothetical protein
VNTLALIEANSTPSQHRFPTALRYLASVQSDFLRRIRGTRDFHPRQQYIHFHLENQLFDWSPTLVEIERPILFAAESGQVKEVQIKKWRDSVGKRLEVIPISGGHTGVWTPEVSSEIARFLCD